MEASKGFIHGLVISGCIAEVVLIGYTFGSNSGWVALSSTVCILAIFSTIFDLV